MRLIFILATLVSQSSLAAVNEILPGDFFPLPPGTTSVALYVFDRVQHGPYVRGKKHLDGRIESSALALRAGRTFKLGNTTLAGVVVLPWAKGSVSPAPLAASMGESAQGTMDFRAGLSAWLVNDKVNANYLGVSGMLVAPTGDYDKRQILNPGENRWKFVLYGGWQKDITPKFLFELSPEIAWYGDNNDYLGNRKLEQRVSYATTGYLRWRVTPAWHVHVGGQINRGGETRIDGVDQRNPASNDRLMAGMTWFLPENYQAILRFAKDTRIDNGFRTDREVTLRLQKSF